MDFREVVYDGIWQEFGVGQQFLWEDVVRRDFNLHENLDTPTVRHKQQVLLRAAEISKRELIGRYVSGMDSTFAKGEALTLGERAYTSYVGTLGDSLIDMIEVSTLVYNHGVIAPRLAIPAAAKAHVLGLQKVELVQFDRDKQDWFWFTIRGNFSAAQAFMEAEISGSRHPEPKLSVTPNVEMTLKADAYLYSLNDVPSGRTQCVIHPSELSVYECDRRIAYGLLGEESREKIAPKLRRIFDIGHIYHDLVQSALGWSFENFHAEVPAKNKSLLINGNCDGVLNRVPRVGLEIKSIGSSGFRKLSKAKDDHIEQATIYGACLDLASVIYFYVCKEDADIKTYEIPLDRARWHKIATRAEGIVKAVETKTLPPQLEGKPSVCDACKYAWTCRPESSNKSRKFTR